MEGNISLSMANLKTKLWRAFVEYPASNEGLRRRLVAIGIGNHEVGSIRFLFEVQSSDSDGFTFSLPAPSDNTGGILTIALIPDVTISTGVTWLYVSPHLEICDGVSADLKAIDTIGSGFRKLMESVDIQDRDTDDSDESDSDDYSIKSDMRDLTVALRDVFKSTLPAQAKEPKFDAVTAIKEQDLEMRAALVARVPFVRMFHEDLSAVLLVKKNPTKPILQTLRDKISYIEYYDEIDPDCHPRNLTEQLELFESLTNALNACYRGIPQVYVVRQRIPNRPGRVLYVGHTTEMADRWKAHDKALQILHSCFLSGDVVSGDIGSIFIDLYAINVKFLQRGEKAWIPVDLFSNLVFKFGLLAERFMINYLNPELNTIFKGRGLAIESVSELIDQRPGGFTVSIELDIEWLDEVFSEKSTSFSQKRSLVFYNE